MTWATNSSLKAAMVDIKKMDVPSFGEDEAK